MTETQIITTALPCGCRIVVTFPRVRPGGMLCMAEAGFMTIKLEHVPTCKEAKS